MAKSHGVSYFPFYFELIPTIEDLEADGFQVSIFLRAVCEYASKFQAYSNALDDKNKIPPSVSGTARQAFRTFKAKIDPRLNAMKSQGFNSASNGAQGGRPPRVTFPPVSMDCDSETMEPKNNLNRLSKTRTGSKKPEQVKQVSDNLNRFPEPEQVSADDSLDETTFQKPEKPEQVSNNQTRSSKTRTGSKKPELVPHNLNRYNRIEKKRREDLALNNTVDNVTGNSSNIISNNIIITNNGDSPVSPPNPTDSDDVDFSTIQDDDSSAPRLEVAEDSLFDVPF